MSFSWSALHAQLLGVTARRSASETYAAIRRAHASDLPFGTIGALLTYLHDADDDPASKNTALRTLISATRERHEWSDLVTTIVLLALWPGLDAVRSRLRRRTGMPPEVLDGELVGQLTLAIRSLDLVRVNRIAATLLRNLERDVLRDWHRRTRETPLSCPVEDFADWVADAPMYSICQVSPEEGRAELHRRLKAELGDTADLVMAVAVDGWTQAEAAERLGIGVDAARKRYQRACARLRGTW